MTDFTITVQETVYDLTVTGDTTTIVKQVIGGPHGHAVSDLWQSGATTGQVPTWNGTAWAPATPSGGGGGGVTDGDKGDIVVSGSGAVWSIDYTAVNAVIAPTWANVTGKPTISGTNTGDQTSIVGITGTLAEFNAALTGDNFATGGGTATGTNTGDETAAGILAKLITVDGAGSGLDADLLDGNSAAAFATAAQGTLAASASQPGHTHAAADVSAPGSTTQIVYNNAGALAGASSVKIESGQLRLDDIASPVTPAAGGIGLFSYTWDGQVSPAWADSGGVTRAIRGPYMIGSIKAETGGYVKLQLAGGSAGPASLYTDLMRIYPAPVMPFDQTFSLMGVNVTTAVGGSLAKVVVYSADFSTNVPSTLLYESTNLDCSSTGFKSAACSLTMRAGVSYWVGVRANSNQTFSGCSALSFLLNGRASFGTSADASITRNLTFATAAPSSWVYLASEITTSGLIPLVVGVAA